MLKRRILLLIILSVVCLSLVTAQETSRLQQLQKELEELEAQIREKGRPALQQELERLQQIQQEMIQVTGALGSVLQAIFSIGRQPESPPVEAEQTQFQEGANAGWPPASAFQNRFALPAFMQPAGTTASYDAVDAYDAPGVTGILVIYVSGGNTNAALNDLKAQIEAAAKEPMYFYNNVYWHNFPDPNYPADSKIEYFIRLDLEQKNNVIKLIIRPVVG